MHKKLILIIAVVCILAFAASAVAQPPFARKWIIKYDGYLQKDAAGTVLADTLIVVNNSNATKPMQIWIEVYDKYGDLVIEKTLLNGGNPLPGNAIPPNGYGWITLGMLVPRATKDPWGIPGGEKFSFKITNDLPTTTPIVEVKQVIYNDNQIPGEAIWQADNIKTWAETCLGGLKGPGAVKVPNKMQW